MLNIQQSHWRHVLAKHCSKTLYLETVLVFQSSVERCIHSITLHSVAVYLTVAGKGFQILGQKDKNLVVSDLRHTPSFTSSALRVFSCIVVLNCHVNISKQRTFSIVLNKTMKKVVLLTIGGLQIAPLSWNSMVHLSWLFYLYMKYM